eukprot:gene26079-11783_t
MYPTHSCEHTDWRRHAHPAPPRRALTFTALGKTTLEPPKANSRRLSRLSAQSSKSGFPDVQSDNKISAAPWTEARSSATGSTDWTAERSGLGHRNSTDPALETQDELAVAAWG